MREKINYMYSVQNAKKYLKCIGQNIGISKVYLERRFKTDFLFNLLNWIWADRLRWNGYLKIIQIDLPPN